MCLGAGGVDPNGGRAGGDTCAPLAFLTACDRIALTLLPRAQRRSRRSRRPGRASSSSRTSRCTVRPPPPPPLSRRPAATLSLFPVRARRAALCLHAPRPAAQCDAATLSPCAEGEWAIGSDGQMKRHGTGTYKSGDNTYEVRTGLLLPCACAAGQLSRPTARRGRGRTTRWTAKASSRSPAAPCTR